MNKNGTVIKVYIDDATHTLLKILADKKDSTISQTAGQLLRNQGIREQTLLRILELLEKILITDEKIQSKFDAFAPYMFANYVIARALADTQETIDSDLLFKKAQEIGKEKWESILQEIEKMKEGKNYQNTK